MSTELIQLARHMWKRGVKGVFLALCRRPIGTSVLLTLGALFVSAEIHAGETPTFSYIFKNPDQFIRESVQFFWGTQMGICISFIVAIPLAYAGLVLPVVRSYLYRKSPDWVNQWKDVDSRVRRCLLSLVAIFTTWALIYVSYTVLDDQAAVAVAVDLLVWMNGLAFLYLWFELRGRTVRQEHKESIKGVLERITSRESTEDEVYDLFTPWESRGEALLTNADVTPDEVVESLKLERDALDALAERSAEEPVHRSELATAELRDTLVLVGLVVVMFVVPAGLFIAQASIGSEALQTLTSFYVASVVAGTSIGLVTTRLASTFLDVSSMVIAAIVLYAALQPAFPFEVLLDDYVSLKTTQVDAVETSERPPGNGDEAGAPEAARRAAPSGDSIAGLILFQESLRAGLFTYSLFGKLVIGVTFLHLLLAGRLHYCTYYLHRSHALLLVHRRLTTKSFPLVRG